MKVLYVTANVLGDAGANAAEIFPRLAGAAGSFDQVVVADFDKNRDMIKDRMGADFLRLRRNKGLRNAARIARKAKREKTDVIHVFYRQSNIPLVIWMRFFLILFRAQARLLVDHRSVNLARGRRGWVKRLSNFIMQPFVHHLAGNPWAVETNHFKVFKPKHLIDLGYDTLPEGIPEEPAPGTPTRIWFIGSLKPRNRKSEFLLDVFDRIAAKAPEAGIEIHVAGPSRPDQEKALNANPLVTYYGRMPRSDLYAALQDKPGIGVAFMNQEFHGYAPSLKFVEYAIMRFHIVASDTIGLRTQAERMNLKDVTFAQENAEEWAETLVNLAKQRKSLASEWKDAQVWSYESIYARQVISLYDKIS